MNSRYRKQTRLRSRRGHRPYCHCPEEYNRLLLLLLGWTRKHGSTLVQDSINRGPWPLHSKT